MVLLKLRMFVVGDSGAYSSMVVWRVCPCRHEVADSDFTAGLLEYCRPQGLGRFAKLVNIRR